MREAKGKTISIADPPPHTVIPSFLKRSFCFFPSTAPNILPIQLISLKNAPVLSSK